MRLLGDNGADLNAAVSTGPLAGWTALHWAAGHGQGAVARALLQLGAHTDAVCSAGRRARDVAAEHEQVEVLEIFREHSVGADAPSDKDLVHLRLRPSARISCAAYGPTEAGRGGEPSARAGLVELSQVGVDGDYPGSARDS